MEVIREDIRAYRIDKDIVKDKKGQRGKIRVANYACVRYKNKINIFV